MKSRTTSLALLLLVVLVASCGRTSSVSTATVTTSPATPTTTSTEAATSSTTSLSVAETTAPPLVEAPTRVAVIGDFGAGTSAEYDVAAAVREIQDTLGLDALVTAGDNFYTDDIDRVWSAPYGWVADNSVAVYAAWGNHDIESQTRADLVAEYLQPPGKWYTVDLGPATLIVLDSNQVKDQDQAAWLERVLAESSGIIVVSFHHPAYSCGEHGSTSSVIEHWVPLFERYGVDLVLNGHDHDYERFIVGGVTYVVTGGGGRPLRSFAGCPEGTPAPLIGDDVHYQFVLLEIAGGSISETAIAVDGTVIDEAVIHDR